MRNFSDKWVIPFSQKLHNLSNFFDLDLDQFDCTLSSLKHYSFSSFRVQCDPQRCPLESRLTFTQKAECKQAKSEKLLSHTHPHATANRYDFLSSLEHKSRCLEKKISCKKKLACAIYFF